ncbi:kinetochore-associated protein DSN1 homolog isoform X2 [Pseudoliparis swirei]|uniref:kinetochore-associated protein DSN1 homolog isoform X2 n=1 Tax=Pseudoliparis swirei TaxID=2059687 RepID=UPI0024BD7B13|nr:kinetochore-associated protein DSN1 homolog isoform X2 [Pseudoliparis swirei]
MLKTSEHCLFKCFITLFVGLGKGPSQKNSKQLFEQVDAVKQTSKRCSSSSPSTPPNKCPHPVFPSTSPRIPDAVEGQSETDKLAMQTEDTEGPSSPTVDPTARRKSWRRATLTRRSLPALPNPYQVLCRSISASLSQQERLEQLMEASMKLAIERTQSSLQSVPNASLDSFQKQVEQMQKEWGCLTKSIRDEPGGQLPARAASSSDPVVQKAMERVQKSINSLQAESESWEALLNKHRSKAEELERKVEQGQKGGVSLDATSVAQSSQYHFIQSKPDYHSILCRQQPMLHTMAMIMDTQSKMVRELLSIKEQSQLLVKETSGRLAAKAGFQDILPDLIRNLIAAPLSSATT